MVDTNKDKDKTEDFKPTGGKTEVQTPKSGSNEDQPSVVRTVDLYNVNDGIHGREGIAYLDQVEQLHQERINAAREGREPDFDHPNTYPGIVTVPKATLQANYNNTLLAGDERRLETDVRATPVDTDVPLFNSDLVDFSVTDENKGDTYEEFAPVLTDEPEKNNATKAITVGVAATENDR